MATMHLGAIEVNPLMKALLEAGPIWFIVVKLLIGILVTLYFIRKKRYLVLRYATYLLSIVVLWNILNIFVGVMTNGG